MSQKRWRERVEPALVKKRALFFSRSACRRREKKNESARTPLRQKSKTGLTHKPSQKKTSIPFFPPFLFAKQGGRGWPLATCVSAYRGSLPLSSPLPAARKKKKKNGGPRCCCCFLRWPRLIIFVVVVFFVVGDIVLDSPPSALPYRPSRPGDAVVHLSTRLSRGESARCLRLRAQVEQSL